MTIDALLEQSLIKGSIHEIKRNDGQGRCLIFINGEFKWEDCDASIRQMLINFNPQTLEIQTIVLYGWDMAAVCDYVDKKGHFMQHAIMHYMKDVNGYPETVTLLTSNKLCF